MREANCIESRFLTADKVARANEKGVVEKRKSVFGTAWYQLEHSSFEVGVRRFQIVKWWGVLGNRKLKTIFKPIEHTCPVCKGSMELGYPYGAEPIVSNRGERGFVKNFAVEHVEDDDGSGYLVRRGGARVKLPNFRDIGFKKEKNHIRK